MSSLTVVMPAYNEEECIAETVADTLTQVLDHVPGSQLLIVNDGSKDKTGEILDRLAAADSRIKIIHQANAGHGAALTHAMNEATGDYLLLIDSDGEVVLDTFATVWENRGSLDAILGFRRTRSDAQIRKLLTNGLRAMLRTVWRVHLRDANAPFKLIRRKVWTDIKPFLPQLPNSPSIMIGVFIGKKGYSYQEVEIIHRGRQTGEVSIKKWKLARYCMRTYSELIDLNKQLRVKKN